MMDLVPYLSGLVTLLFGIAFYLGLQEFRDIEDKDVG